MTPEIPPHFSFDDLVSMYLRGWMAPGHQLLRDGEVTTAWHEIMRSTTTNERGWVVNPVERAAAAAPWRLVVPIVDDIVWQSGSMNLDALRGPTLHADSRVQLDAPGAHSIPLARLLALPSPVAPAQRRGRGLAAVGAGLLFSTAMTGFVLLAYKGMQAAFDEDFGTTEFPATFRRELIDHHVARYGSYCPRCRRSVPREALTVDHIVALANGGRTSRANAAVLCRRCNSSKGARNTAWDHIRGRAA